MIPTSSSVPRRLSVVVCSLFPDQMTAFLTRGLLGKAFEASVSLTILDLRAFGYTRHGHVDDAPYGGRRGMILRADVLAAAIESIPGYGSYALYHPCATGPLLTQAMVTHAAQHPMGVIMIPGYYEGIDARLLDAYGIQPFSIGDLVLMTGEAPVVAFIEAMVRLIPGVIHDPVCLEDDSFPMGILEHPQYTKPRVFKNHEVPGILTQGNHSKIADWKRGQSLGRTVCARPELIQGVTISGPDKVLLRTYIQKM